jgi:hypothetical protein
MKPLMIATSFNMPRRFAVPLLHPRAVSAREPSYYQMLKLWIRLGRLGLVDKSHTRLPSMKIRQQLVLVTIAQRSFAAPTHTFRIHQRQGTLSFYIGGFFLVGCVCYISLIVVFLSSGVSCKVCDGDVRENMPIPDVIATCEDIVALAEIIDETSDDCPILQYAEALCCPSAASTCSICKGTKLFADVEVVDSTGVTLTCGEVALDAAEYEALSTDCESYQSLEEYCCPENAATIRKSSITNPLSMSLIKTQPRTYSR